MKKTLSLLLVLAMLCSLLSAMGSFALADGEGISETQTEETVPSNEETVPSNEKTAASNEENATSDEETESSDVEIVSMSVPESVTTIPESPDDGAAGDVADQDVVEDQGGEGVMLLAAAASESDGQPPAEGELTADGEGTEGTEPAAAQPAGELTVGGTYALFVSETLYLLNDSGTLKTNAASSGNYSTSNPRGAITPAAGSNGGYTFTINGSPLGVADGQMALVASAGEWFYSGGVLSYVEGGSTLYVAGGDLSMGPAQGAAVRMIAITASSSSSKSPGGGNSDNTYSRAITNASVPNLVYIDAPHWINLSNSGHETTKTVSLSARFPDGVTSDAMTFLWSFGEKTFTETIPVSQAVDGIFTSSFTVSVEGLDAGVYPVSCAISYKIGDDEIIVTEPDDSTATEGASWTYTLGDNTKKLIETEVRGKPTVTIDGSEITIEEDRDASPPASYIPADVLEALTAGKHDVVIEGDGGPESHELTIVDPNASAGASSLTVGASYNITFEVDGVTYAVGLDGSSVVAVTPDNAAVWVCEEDSGKTYLKSGDYYLTHDGSTLTTSSKGSNVTYAGTLKIKNGKGQDRQVSGVSGSAITVDKTAGISVTLTAAASDKKITAGEGYTYTLGINKDLVIPTDDKGPHTVTLKSAAVDFTEKDEKITIAASVIEALSAGSYTIAVTDTEDAVVNHKLTVQNPPQIDVNVNVILARGVQTNSFITFSDVHETWEDVGTAVYDTIIATNGLIPALIIATGDFNNNQLSGNDATKINGAVNEIINRVSLQLAGIDTVWVSGNHDNGYAAQYTNYNQVTDLGINIDDYANEDEGISGTGIIFDTRSDGYAKNADSSQFVDGLIVIGLNYEDGNSFSKNDYGTGEEEGDSVYKHIKTALERVAANYNGELVVISSHAGLHNLAADEDGSTTSNDNGYSISNSAAIVKLVNEYVEKYKMDVVWLFGHDHSRGEEELIKLPGATITATNTFGATENETEDIVLNFTYAHAGYVGKGAAGINNRNYTLMTWNDTAIIRKEGVADGSHTYRDFLETGLDHYYGTKGTLSFTLDRIEKIISQVIAGSVSDADKATFRAFAVPAGFERYAFFEVAGFKVADGNKTPATADEIKGAELSFVLPFPDDLDFSKFDYEFKVLHLTPDGVKEESFVQTAAGLQLNPESLSPFAIVWKQTEKAPANPNTNPGTNPGTKAPGAKAPAKPGEQPPKTGDEDNLILWIVLFVVLAGSAVAVLPRKKHSK